MKRIKFIYEARSKRIFMSVLSACILIFSAIGLLVDKDSSGFFFGVAFAGVLYGLLEFIGLFLYKHFVFLGNEYALIRINSFFFKTVLLDQLDSVEIIENTLRIHLSHKAIDINIKGISPKDVNRLQMFMSTSAKA
ncbi:hypothetical protein LB456_00370 [Psychroflexus sp. CAK57W]|uniref:hypothetical protein n=1 Tax=Psychroflexus curvus TaxID=2873595 RepID=UPI001CCAC524|nr:hypothetical protein [Psychroflexus curvus]MBZ9785901.1 hypothetical protein [Psychroflexus curvus]